jgi:TonB family protein
VESYPDALEQVVMRALDKTRETRFPSITDLLEALENAVPSAFGPRADEMVATYVQKLTKDRLQERRSTLRIAEEWAETSSSRHSVSSLPAVTASSAPAAKSSRAAWFGAGGVLTGLAVAAVAATVYFRTPTDVPGAAAGGPIRVDEPSPPDHVSAVAKPASPPLQDSSRPSSAVRAPAAASPEAAVGSAPRREENVARRTRLDPSEREAHKRDTATEPPESEAVTEPTSQDADASELAAAPDQARVAAAPIVTAALPPVPMLVPQPQPAASTAPRLLASKLGQRQLLTNPSSKAVRVPSALRRSGQTFSATVNICVAPSGEVTKVDVLRSAGPALDPQIVDLLSRWRYRPLLEGGRATPFCYPLKYQVESE